MWGEDRGPRESAGGSKAPRQADRYKLRQQVFSKAHSSGRLRSSSFCYQAPHSDPSSFSVQRTRKRKALVVTAVAILFQLGMIITEVASNNDNGARLSSPRPSAVAAEENEDAIDPCTTENAADCIKPIWQYISANDLQDPIAFPSYTERVLNVICRTKEQMQRCVQRSEKSKCSVLDHIQIIKGYLETIDYLCTLCTEDRAVYQAHRTCVSSPAVRRVVHACNVTYYDRIGTLQPSATFDGAGTIWRVCRLMDQLVECIHGGVEKVCGPIAALLYRNISERYMEPTRNHMSCRISPTVVVDGAPTGIVLSYSPSRVILCVSFGVIVLFIVSYILCMRVYWSRRRLARPINPNQSSLSNANCRLQVRPSEFVDEAGSRLSQLRLLSPAASVPSFDTSCPMTVAPEEETAEVQSFLPKIEQ